MTTTIVERPSASLPQQIGGICKSGSAPVWKRAKEADPGRFSWAEAWSPTRALKKAYTRSVPAVLRKGPEVTE